MMQIRLIINNRLKNILFLNTFDYFFLGFIISVFLRSKAKQVISSLSLSDPQLSSDVILSTIFFGETISKLFTILSTPSAPSSWPFCKYPSVTPSV